MTVLLLPFQFECLFFFRLIALARTDRYSLKSLNLYVPPTFFPCNLFIETRLFVLFHVLDFADITPGVISNRCILLLNP